MNQTLLYNKSHLFTLNSASYFSIAFLWSPISLYKLAVCHSSVAFEWLYRHALEKHWAAREGFFLSIATYPTRSHNSASLRLRWAAIRRIWTAGIKLPIYISVCLSCLISSNILVAVVLYLPDLHIWLPKWGTVPAHEVLKCNSKTIITVSKYYMIVLAFLWNS